MLSTNLKRYFTGNPCSNGHIAERYVSCNACVKCQEEKRKKWGNENPNKAILASRNWERRNPNKHAAIRKSAWARTKSDYSRQYTYNAERRAKRRQAVPPWITKEHREAIRILYTESKRLTLETGIKHNVDHIFPLTNKICCGLHVPWNLQIITQEENFRKHNSIPQSH